jgi:hypothetical protein
MTEKLNFNKILFDCVKDKDFIKLNNTHNNMNEKNLKKLEKEYDATFDDILTFRKIFTKKKIDEIDTIIFHDENNDGMFAASVVYKYLKENDKKGTKKINIIPSKPGKFFPKEDFLRGKNVIIVDISFEPVILQNIIKFSDSLIVIDDHRATLEDKNIFNGDKHAACAYTWKFFYPKKDVPKIIQYIDSSDAKLFLKHLPKYYSKFITDYLGFRYTHNKSKLTQNKKRDGRLFEEFSDIFDEDLPNSWIMIGFYYDQVSDNLKEQIAINATKINFQGYSVGILNFLSPQLTHPVCRQIVSNFKQRGDHIDFAVCWGYEHINNSYRVQMLDDHVQTKINLGDLAAKLGKIGGSIKKGGGHPHIGNFYWNRDKNHDIWDLFNKRLI